MPLPNVTAGVPTRLRLGAWDTVNDVLIAHPASPTGAVIDLNDGANWSLADDTAGMGTGLHWDTPRPTIYSSKNPRTVGPRLVKRVYESERTLKVKLVLGPTSSWATYSTTIHNLTQLLEGITPENPAALELRPVQASTSLYVDVLAGWFVKADYKETLWNQLIDDGIELEFFCRPHLRGPRQTLQNFIVNPGFEQPSGPGVQVFSDTFANTNAYTVQSGASPTLNTPQYKNVVLGDVPLRYYRLDQGSGTVATDSSASAQNGTYSAAGITYNVAGALSGCGDSDTAVTLAAATPGNVSVPTTGLSTGNGAWTLECWFKIAANPASFGVLAFMGTNSGRNGAQMYLNNLGNVIVDAIGIGGVTSTGTVSLNTWHHAVGTWDGTTMRLYVDGAAMGTPTTPGALTLTMGSAFLGQQPAGSSPYNGSIDEACIYNVALSAAQVAAHYNVATTSSNNTMTLPATSRVAFGSPQWGAINTWQLRFMYMTNMAYDLYLHYTDASNYLKVNCNGSTYTLNHTIAGVNSVLATVTQTLTNGTWYWWRITQFPTPSGTGYIPYVQALLANDSSGAVGSTVTTIGPVQAANYSTAMTGRPQIACSGATLVLGGNYTGVHTLSLFGPGAWMAAGQLGAATALSWCSWEQNSANTATLGLVNTTLGIVQVPFPSGACARIDLAASGTVDAAWNFYNGGGTMPPANAIATAARIYVAVAVRSTGLGSSAILRTVAREYDSTGTFLRSGTVASLTGNQTAWTVLYNSYLPGASCTYIDLQFEVVDTSAPGASANGTVWFDNAQCWTTYNPVTQPTMPYCETRFPQSPAQVQLSGIVGDVAVPCLTVIGTRFGAGGSAFAPGSALSVLLGRRSTPTATAPLIGALFAGSTAPLDVPVLDSTAWGGFYYATASAVTTWTPGLAGANGTSGTVYPPQLIANLKGVYVVKSRLLTKQTLGNLANQKLTGQQALIASILSSVAFASTQVVQPFAASSQWTIVDSGRITIPPLQLPSGNDGTGVNVNLLESFSDSTGGGAVAQANWMALIPADVALYNAVINNPSGSPTTMSNTFFWLFVDGSLTPLNGRFSTAYNFNYAYLQQVQILGGPGTLTSAGGINVNPLNDPYLTLDPNQRVSGNVVNQLVGYLADTAGALGALPFYTEFSYTPLYLIPN